MPASSPSNMITTQQYLSLKYDIDSDKRVDFYLHLF
jgi:hypothetical protein